MIIKQYFFILSLALIALMLCSSVYAAFSISTEKSELTACIGSTLTIVDKVIGTEGKYTVEASGTAKAFTTTVPTEFTLKTSQNIYSYATVSSKIKPGVYDLKIKVTSDNVRKEQTHTITAKDCHGTSLTVDSQKNICPCDKIKYNLALENLGEFNEKFSITVEGTAKAWTNISESKIELDSGESEEFYAYVSAPCNVSGKYTLTFKAVAEASLAGAVAESTVDILPCYEYELGIEKNYSICENEKIEIPLNINNKGTADNKFKIVLGGPEWAKLDADSIDIASESKDSINIIAQPPFKTEGNFTLKLETMTDSGNVKKTANTSVSVRRCYGVDLSVPEEDKLCGKEKEYTIAVNNLGEFEGKYALSLDGPDWAELDESSINVDAKSNGTVKLKVSVPENAEYKKYDIIIKAVDSESQEEDSSTMALELSKPEECYKPELTTEDEEISVGLEESKTLFLLLKNKGLDEATYNIDIKGSGAKFAIINPEEVTLKAGESETLYLYVSPPLFTDLGEYNLSVIAEETENKVTAEKTILVNLGEEKEQAENNTAEEEAEAAKIQNQPIFIWNLGIKNFIKNTIASISNFFKKLLMVQPPVVNEAEINESALELSVEQVSNETVANETIEPNETEEINVSDEQPKENTTIEEENTTITGEAVSNESEEQVPAEQANETEQVKSIKNFNEEVGKFYSSNKTYLIGAGVIVLLIIIISSGIGKAIVKFFEEDD